MRTGIVPFSDNPLPRAQRNRAISPDTSFGIFIAKIIMTVSDTIFKALFPAIKGEKRV